MKKTILILMGGNNTEHEVSLQSAKNILQALSSEKYKILPVGIDKSGIWHLMHGTQIQDYFKNSDNPKTIALGKNKDICRLVNVGSSCVLKTKDQTVAIDIVFPALHGKNAEDGHMQGFLEILDVAYVGSDTLSSANCFDKASTKVLLREAGLRVAPGEVVRRSDLCLNFTTAKKRHGTPLFVKPSRSGSSVGVHKVTNEEQYKKAIIDAFQNDSKILIESAVTGRELECAIKGNTSDPSEQTTASVIGEVLVSPDHDFYNYDAKYLNRDGAKTTIPANLTKKQAESLQDQALKAYKALGCDGLARVDMFLTGDDEIYINEINTLPGFTNISMYPKLWEASGITYSKLLDELIDLALERKNL